MASDAKAFYGYLFEVDKKPTRTLDALLRGIAGYISENVGNTEQKALTPDKLATFYKAVGGNYDSLFVQVPDPSISWIYASIGCQHTLQPTTDFEPPSIPALTTKGFVRWQSIEILLGPEEHVPFIQNAVRDFGIKHPDTGVLFPHPVPKEAFPLHADPDIEKWHDQCAQQLRKRATPEEKPVPPPPEPEFRPEMPPRPQVKTTYIHVRPTRPTMRAETEYFPRTSQDRVSRNEVPRPFYQHVHSGTGQPVRPVLSRSPSHRARQFLAPEDNLRPSSGTQRSRRRSFPEPDTSPINSPNPSTNGTAGVAEPVRSPSEDYSPRARRHSHHGHARRASIASETSTSDDEAGGGGIETPPTGSEGPRRRIRRKNDFVRPPSASEGVRFSAPPSQQHSPIEDPRVRARRPQPVTVEDEEVVNAKRRSRPVSVDFSGKGNTRFLLEKKDRDRERERERERERIGSGRSTRSTSRGNGNLRWKDLESPDFQWRSSGEDGPGNGPGNERERRRERHRERDREREREDYKRERGREKRYVSPLRGVDGRRYPGN